MPVTQSRRQWADFPHCGAGKLGEQFWIERKRHRSLRSEPRRVTIRRPRDGAGDVNVPHPAVFKPKIIKNSSRMRIHQCDSSFTAGAFGGTGDAAAAEARKQIFKAAERNATAAPAISGMTPGTYTGLAPGIPSALTAW